MRHSHNNMAAGWSEPVHYLALAQCLPGHTDCCSPRTGTRDSTEDRDLSTAAPRILAPPRTAPPRPLRVVFALDNFGVGGTELNAVRTAERLDRDRVALSVVALQEDGPLRARYDAVGVPVTVFPLRNLYGLGAIRQGLRLASWLRRERPDIVHCHDIFTNIFVGAWARVGGASKVIASRRWGSSSSQPRLDRLNGLVSRRASRLLTNSTTVRSSLVHHDGYRADRMAVIPNFLEAEAFSADSPEQVRARRRSLQIPEDVWVVGVVARLAPVKDHAMLLRAVSRLTAAGVLVHIVLVGDGPERRNLERLAQELGLDGRVTFTGTLPNRPNPHELFDVTVLTSRSEGFPNTVVEAMAAGRPVVATRVGGVPDAVRPDVTGLLVPAGDVAALAGALEQLRQSPTLARRLGEAGRTVARAEFSEKVVLERLMTLYEELAR